MRPPAATRVHEAVIADERADDAVIADARADDALIADERAGDAVIADECAARERHASARSRIRTPVAVSANVPSAAPVNASSRSRDAQ
jgi:hypothetical protein